MKMGRNFLHIFCVVLALFYNGISKVSAVINGGEAELGEFKYMVTFWNSTLHLCGGAILDDWHVLTSAHCIIPDEKTFHENAITLVAGTTNFKGNESTTFRTTVEKIYVTDRYNHSKWKYILGSYDDVAVLKIKDKFNLQDNPNLAAIQLPENITDIDAYDNKTLRFAGYGYQYLNLTLGNATVTETGFTTGQLHKTLMSTVLHSECEREFFNYYFSDPETLLNTTNSEVVEATTSALPEVTTAQSDLLSSNSINNTADMKVLRDYHLCVRMTQHGLQDTEQRGLCTGDSGSPLVDGNTVIGVVSFNGYGCDERIVPTVFTMISHYLDFIKNAMNDTVVEGMRVSSTLPAEYLPVPVQNNTKVYNLG